MSSEFKVLAIAVALATTTIPTLAGAATPGCANLPESARASGVLQGLSTCDMTLEEANRIVYGRSAASAQAAPAPRRHRRHRVRAVQPY